MSKRYREVEGEHNSTRHEESYCDGQSSRIRSHFQADSQPSPAVFSVCMVIRISRKNSLPLWQVTEVMHSGSSVPDDVFYFEDDFA